MTKQCNWSENKTINEKLVTVNCESTNTVRDKDNVNERWFCIEKHIEEVNRVRKIMHMKCINKEKLIKYFNELPKNQKLTTETLYVLDTIFEKIENGELH